MINQTYIDDKKIKDILTYISGMRHAEQIRMMFLCSLNGMRSINFCYLQIKDVYNPDLSVKDVICLDENKNKGKFGANYYLNSQMKKEFKEYLKFLKSKEEVLTPDNYLFKSQKLNKPYNRVSISRLFSNIYKKFNIHGASHLGRHSIPTSIRLQLAFWLIVFHCFTQKNSSSNCFSLRSVSKLVNSGVNICLVQRLANHRNISTTQRYFNYNPQMLSNAVESLKI